MTSVLLIIHYKIAHSWVNFSLSKMDRERREQQERMEREREERRKRDEEIERLREVQRSVFE